MASKKNLKKDINFLADDLIGTCMMHQSIGNTKNENELNQIIEDILVFRDETIKQVNEPELQESDKSMRKYYRELYQKFLQKVDETYEKINSLTE